MFEAKKSKRKNVHGDDEDILDYPFCHVCGRVVTEEDHTDEAGTDGTIYWDQYLHSPAGLEELAELIAAAEAEAERVKAESESRLQAMIAEAVRDALAERGVK